MLGVDGTEERVALQLSIDGLKVLDGARVLRSYSLRHVTRWDLLGGSAVVWTKSDVDVEERPLTLSGDRTTLHGVIDALASCCLQLAEVIQGRDDAGSHGPGSRSQRQPDAASEVEFWHAPDKAGWLLSQAEVLRTWRRRWFVLKGTHLFRFLSPGDTASPSSRPRGVVDLALVQDVRDGRRATGRPHALQLVTAAGGSVCYVCESETEMAEWMSALEGALNRAVLAVAGEQQDGGGSGSCGRQQGGGADNWARTLERRLQQQPPNGGGGDTLVSIVDFGGGVGSNAAAGSAVDAWHVAGGAPHQPHQRDASAVLNDDMSLNYGTQQQQQQQQLAWPGSLIDAPPHAAPAYPWQR